MQSEHLLLIDKQLTQIPTNLLHSDIVTINLHCNNIQKIFGLSNLSNLTSLDLSANRISSISGIDNLNSLQYLNLASNFISKVDNLFGLLQLKYINLSYNKITSLNGFVELHAPDVTLQVVLLHGNKLTNARHIILCMHGLISLRHLVLSHNGQLNPAIKFPQYRDTFLKELPQIVSLDYQNRNDEIVEIDESFQFLVSPSQPLPTIQNTLTDCDSLDSSSVMKEDLKVSLKSDDVSVAEAPIESPAKQATVVDDPTTIEEQAQKDSDDSSTLKSCASAKKQVPNVKHLKKKECLITLDNHKSYSKSSTTFIEKKSYTNLLKDLEVERERRWKAEEVSRKLAGLLREMKSQNIEDKSLQETAACVTERVKQALLAERESTEVLKTENQTKSKKIKFLNEKLSAMTKENCTTVQNLKSALTNANAKLERLRAECCEDKKELQSSLRDLSGRYNAVSLKNEQLMGQLDNLKSLFVAKEFESRKPCRHENVDGEFERKAANELNELKKMHQEEVFVLEQKQGILQTELMKLENEFREALMIESERYKSLHENYNVANEKAQRLETSLAAANEREVKCRSMMTQMTSIIKEQKTKTIEMASSKEELSKHYGAQLDKLQQEVTACRKKNEHFELIKREKSLLASKVNALQSVIDGLKEERGVWGRELAEQGVSLSKDRGRLEMKIEVLRAEVESLRKNNERDLDSLRIKTKVVEDQTETIHKMKEALASKDTEVRMKLDEHVIEQQKLLETIEDLTKENSSLQEENTNLLSRKHQLKNEVSKLNCDFEELQQEHEKQKSKWLAKGDLLSKLEEQVKNASLSNKQKQDVLMRERDEALLLVNRLNEKNSKLFESYQEELHTATSLHEKEVEKVRRDKEEEMSRMKEKIDLVEIEMTELLKETDLKRKCVDSKVNKLKLLLEEFS